METMLTTIDALSAVVAFQFASPNEVCLKTF
jgi:hypothetical protein